MTSDSKAEQVFCTLANGDCAASLVLDQLARVGAVRRVHKLPSEATLGDLILGPDMLFATFSEFRRKAPQGVKVNGKVVLPTQVGQLALAWLFFDAFDPDDGCTAWAKVRSGTSAYFARLDEADLCVPDCPRSSVG